jgi:hypothetical protein
MILIGQRLAYKGWTLRSGRAQGADQAFEYGCDISQGEKEIYLPWSNFPGDGHYDYPEQFLKASILLNGPSQVAIELAYMTLGDDHWKRLTQGGHKLHARNMHQVLGHDLNAPADMLICWAKPKGMHVEGGTNTAWKLGKLQEGSTRCFNLYHEQDYSHVMSMLY